MGESIATLRPVGNCPHEDYLQEETCVREAFLLLHAMDNALKDSIEQSEAALKELASEAETANEELQDAKQSMHGRVSAMKETVSRTEGLLQSLLSPRQLWTSAVEILGVGERLPTNEVDSQCSSSAKEGESCKDAVRASVHVQVDDLDCAVKETTEICDTYMGDMHVSDELLNRLDNVINSLE